MTINQPAATKAAFLVENGFCERELVQAQNALKAMNVDCRIISVSTTLVKAWREEEQKTLSNWGSEYAADALLKAKTSSDFDILVLPGGQRSIEKLKLHTDVKSFLTGFINVGKPVIAYNQGISLLAFHGLIKAYDIAEKENAANPLKIISGKRISSDFVVSKNLITLTRYTQAEEKIKDALTCVINNTPYIEKTESSDTLSRSHKVA